LNALVGNINKKGGIRAVSDIEYINWPEIEMDARAATGMQQERLDGAGSGKYLFSRYLTNLLPEIVNSGEKYPLQALFVSDANPLYTFPDTKSIEKAFGKIPLFRLWSAFLLIWMKQHKMQILFFRITFFLNAMKMFQRQSA